jgi:hypothetical protein
VWLKGPAFESRPDLFAEKQRRGGRGESFPTYVYLSEDSTVLYPKTPNTIFKKFLSFATEDFIAL